MVCLDLNSFCLYIIVRIRNLFRISFLTNPASNISFFLLCLRRLITDFYDDFSFLQPDYFLSCFILHR